MSGVTLVFLITGGPRPAHDHVILEEPYSVSTHVSTPRCLPEYVHHMSKYLYQATEKGDVQIKMSRCVSDSHHFGHIAFSRLPTRVGSPAHTMVSV